MSLYEGMLNLYRDISEYNMIDVLDQSQMVGYGVEDDAAIDFDKLNPLEFKECLDFIMAHYQEAHNNNNKSRSHQPFADYTSRKPYLLYLHLWSAEIGDEAFSNCVYSILPSELPSLPARHLLCQQMTQHPKKHQKHQTEEGNNHQQKE